MQKKEDGITLLALIITIIVILLLAGVMLHNLTNPNNIVDQADKSVQEYKEQENETNDAITGLKELLEKFLNK